MVKAQRLAGTLGSIVLQSPVLNWDHQFHRGSRECQGLGFGLGQGLTLIHSKAKTKADVKFVLGGLATYHGHGT